MMITLTIPQLDHESICMAFLNECQAEGTEMAGTSNMDSMPFSKWVDYVEMQRQGIDTLDGYVPATTFLCFVKEALVGIVNIRHFLNENLLEAGGHIGYMVRPSERRRGYATAILKEALVYCKEVLGIDEILVTCSPENIGSKKTILACGGVLENVAKNTFLGTVERYWIRLER